MTETSHEDIPVVVLTGGPCSGKTSAIARVHAWATELGFHVATVPETATELIGNGLSPETIPLYRFEQALLRAQLERERRYEEALRYSPQPRRVIVCDRGAKDVAAYLPPGEFARLLEEEKLFEDELDHRYHGVIHLRTAPRESYTQANNPARFESYEEAAHRDILTLQAWTGTPHLSVIGNEGGFERKMLAVRAALARILGIPEPIEDERKFRVKPPSPENLRPPGAVEIDIVQHYLLPKEGVPEERVRRRGRPGSGAPSYYHTIKEKTGTIGVRIERERIISEREHNELLRRADPKSRPIRKTRHCFVFGNQYFELDRFWEPHRGLWLLEVELSTEQREISLPSWIEDAIDVTDNPDYSNRELARICK